MPAGLLIKNQQMYWNDRNTYIRWRRRDAAITSQCAEVYLSLMGEDEAEYIEGLETFNYLERMLD